MNKETDMEKEGQQPSCWKSTESLLLRDNPVNLSLDLRAKSERLRNMDIPETQKALGTAHAAPAAYSVDSSHA